MGQIYVTQAGQQRGPFTELEARKLINTGDLSAGDLTWKEGMEHWESCRQ